MSTSLLYHAFGLRGYDYVKTEYLNGTVVFTIHQRPHTRRCPLCGSREVLPHGAQERTFKAVPIGGKPVNVVLPIPRVECRACQIVRQIKQRAAQRLWEVRWLSGPRSRHFRFERPLPIPRSAERSEGFGRGLHDSRQSLDHPRAGGVQAAADVFHRRSRQGNRRGSDQRVCRASAERVFGRNDQPRSGCAAPRLLAWS